MNEFFRDDDDCFYFILYYPHPKGPYNLRISPKNTKINPPLLKKLSIKDRKNFGKAKRLDLVGRLNIKKKH